MLGKVLEKIRAGNEHSGRNMVRIEIRVRVGRSKKGRKGLGC